MDLASDPAGGLNAGMVRAIDGETSGRLVQMAEGVAGQELIIGLGGRIEQPYVPVLL